MEHLDTQNQDFIVASEAAKVVGYTSDYITRLAREKKIEGQKVGRQWFVSLTSVREFTLQSAQEKQTRNSQLREERKLEQKLQPAQPKNTIADKVKLRLASGKQIALVQTGAIVVLGLVIGATMHVTSVQSQLANTSQSAFVGEAFFGFIAEKFYSVISPQQSVVVSEETFERDENSMAVGNPPVLTEVQTSDSYGLIVLSEEDLEAERERIVENAFSDDVEVRFDIENPEEGVVTPNFKSGPGDPYDFLLLLNQKLENSEDVSIQDSGPPGG